MERQAPLRSNSRYRHAAGFLAGVVVFAVALWLLHHELKQYHYRDIVMAAHNLPAHQIVQAVGLMIVSYILLTVYDVLGFRYIGRTLSYARIALGAFVGYVLSHNATVLGGTAARYRVYSTWGISGVDIARVVAFGGLTYWLGLLLVGGIAFLVEPFATPANLHLPVRTVRPVGIVFLALVILYFVLCATRDTPFQIRGWKISLPSPGMAAIQAVISSTDWLVGAAVVYVLFPHETGVSFPLFLCVYLFAASVGMLSHVPGGLGVFETLMVMLLPSPVAPTALLGSLLVYRAIYYLLPLSVAVFLLVGHEAVQRKATVVRTARHFGQAASTVVPSLLACTTFIGGAILLLSGATPPVHGRFVWLRSVLPLPVMEASHFLASLVGTALMLLARGLQRRIDAAYFASVILLATGVVFSLLKGLDYEAAAALTLMCFALLPCRSHFYRKASLLRPQLVSGWAIAVAIVLITTGWLVLFAYNHVEYSGDLWWRFALDAHAPRALRATAAAAVITGLFAFAHLLRPAAPVPAPPHQDELHRIRAIVRNAPDSSAHLALLGDKRLLLNDTATAFIMYGVSGRSWVSMGDPVGPREEHQELAWRFHELADRHGGRTVFYEVGEANLPVYVELGLALLKLGEEARVPLETFSLEGGTHKGLRRTQRSLEKQGCAFSVVPEEQVSVLLPELRRISDAWLVSKTTREKGFSLGFFSEDYLSRFPVAVVRQADGLVAFANLWLASEREELSIDLMRYVPDAPQGVMEYLFIELMFWGRREGYRWFNLGMAPFSGLDSRPLAPLWNRLGALAFRYGEHFYNFRGLRQYKEKFGPVWEPKYLASPGGVALARVFTDLATLTSGSVAGIVSKRVCEKGTFCRYTCI